MNATCPLCFEFCNCNFFESMSVIEYVKDELLYCPLNFISMEDFEFYWIFNMKLKSCWKMVTQFKNNPMMYSILWHFQLSSIITYIRSTQTLWIHSNFSSESFIAWSHSIGCISCEWNNKSLVQTIFIRCKARRKQFHFQDNNFHQSPYLIAFSITMLNIFRVQSKKVSGAGYSSLIFPLKQISFDQPTKNIWFRLLVWLLTYCIYAK